MPPLPRIDLSPAVKALPPFRFMQMIRELRRIFKWEGAGHFHGVLWFEEEGTVIVVLEEEL